MYERIDKRKAELLSRFNAEQLAGKIAWLEDELARTVRERDELLFDRRTWSQGAWNSAAPSVPTARDVEDDDGEF